MTDIYPRSAFLSACLLLLVACSEPPPIFHDVERPLRLSDWQLFTMDANELAPSESSVVFQPNNPLFTDYRTQTANALDTSVSASGDCRG